MKLVKGSFEVKSSPLELDAVAQELGLMRMKFDKTFEGPLAGTSVVLMMGMMDQKTGSGAYVALEKITGELDSKKGSFFLQHSSSMDKGTPKQSVLVVPGSGQGELSSIDGSMVIDIVDGKHFYSFSYSL